jgi:cephalosporin-C deacetylase
MFTHNLPFDPTYGYTESQMLEIEPPTPNDDFEAFWRGKFRAALDVPTHISLAPFSGQSRRDDILIEEINFDAMGLNGAPPVRIGGWLIRPTKVEPTRLEVQGHGYGGRDAPDPGPHNDPTIRLQVCKRGFHRSLQPDLPVNDGGRHVLVGIGSRETYIHLGNAADLWAGVKVLAEMFPHLSHRLDYSGGSFGGGIGAMAMPWDDRVRRVFIDVPSFGNHPLRLKCQCNGSGESVRQLHVSGHDVAGVLHYFDSAITARFMDKPTLVGCARFDPAVPPPGQFSVYNAIPCEKKLVARDGGHFEYPRLARDQVELGRAARDWFSI